MAKSNYPSSLDTSKELPPVRDNILEIGSETINGLRSAIFNIERALGINPQGSSGNTVANRLNAISDGSGKIRKEALTLANVLSGPIANTDVANTAAIAESKLRLNFPTQVLQDEISIVSGEINALITQIDEISSVLSVHINSAAINRHKAAAISVVPPTAVGSDSSLIDLEATDVQQALEDLHNRHINYTGSSITETNNSHTADQIYFDDSNVSGVLSADDVQEAIEEAVLLTSIEAIQHQDRLHSNGYIRNGFIKDPENDAVGLILATDQVVNFAESSGESDGLSKITFNTSIVLGSFVVEKGDLIIIEDEADTNELYVGTYEIASANLSVDGLELDSVEVYGFLHGSDTSTTLVTVAKNPRQPQAKYGLALGVREKSTLTSADTIQVANPSAVGIISITAEPSEITSTNRFITVSVNGGTAVTIDLYDVGSSVQSVESMAKRVNEQAAEGNYNFLAYRIEKEAGSVELAIVHNQPSDSTLQHTLEIGEGSDDALTSAGFASYKDLEISTGIDALYFINGNPLSGLKKKLNTTGLSFFSGGISVTIGNTSTNFLTSKVKEGDLLIITDATDSSDDGSFVISGVAEQTLTLSSDQLPAGFAGAAADNTTFEVYDSVLSLDSVVFDEVVESLGAAIIECYMTEDQSLVFNKRLEYQVELSGLDTIFTIVDVSDGVADGDELVITLENVNSTPFVSIDGGTSKRIAGTSYYTWVKSGSSNKKLKIFIPSAASLQSYIIANGTITNTIYGYSALNTQSNMLLGRVPFGNYKGRVIGGIGIDNPRIFSEVDKGTVAWDDLGSSAREHAVFAPVRDLRTGGIISGLEVASATIADGLYNIQVDPGVCYVDGKKFEIPSHIIITDIPSASVDKFYIAISTEGDIVFAAADVTTCDNPYAGSDYVTIATVEYDNVTVRIIDVRLFISNIDLKILNSITVSPDPRLGHFSSVPAAIKYAKRFSDLYPDAGIPTVHLKSGTHEVTIQQDESTKDFLTWLTEFSASPSATLNTLHTLVHDDGVFIDFPLNLEGEGDGTVLKVRSEYTFSDQTVNFRGVIFIPGDGFTTITAPNDVFNSGFIKISNMKIDNARISMVDLNTETGSTMHTFGVDIDNIIFDTQNFTGNLFDSYIGNIGVQLAEVDDEIEPKGNVRINNCKFIDSFFKITEKTRVRNLRFSNNTLFGDSVGYLIDEEIATFEYAEDGSNIEIYGNYVSDNKFAVTNASSPLLTETDRMATRMESNLFLGGNLESGGNATASSFSYNNSQSAYRHIYMDDMRFAALDGGFGSFYLNMDSTVSGMRFCVYNNGTRGVHTVQSDPNTSDRMVVRLPEIRAGQTLTAIAIYYYIEAPSNISVPYDIDIYSEDHNFVRTTEYSGGTTASYVTATLGICSKYGLSIVGGSTKHFTLGLQRASASTLKQYITHISYVVSTETVEGIGGF
jgi:hypothetical protein